MNGHLQVPDGRPAKRRRIDIRDVISQEPCPAESAVEASSVFDPSSPTISLFNTPSSVTLQDEEQDLFTRCSSVGGSDTWVDPRSSPRAPSNGHAKEAQCAASEIVEEGMISDSTTAQIELGASSSTSTQSEIVCFGMLRHLRMTPIRQKDLRGFTRITPVILIDNLVLTADDNRAQIGHLDDWTKRVLVTLARQDGLVLQCRTNLENPALRRGNGSAHPAKRSVVELSVILYGPMKYFDAVGTFLVGCELYLQDPDGCDRTVRYRNPQCLWGIDDHEMKWTRDAAPAVRYNFDQFQDSVDLLKGLECEQELAEADQPSILNTSLHRHQKQALTFMSLREQGWSFRGPLEDLWRLEQDFDGQRIYVNAATGERQFEQPHDFRGGVLGDHMGLGKSLSIIALIARDKDETRDRMLLDSTYSVPSTLVVVRAPLLQTWKDQFRLHVKPGALRCRVHHGKERIKDSSELDIVDVVLTTYQTLVAEYRKSQTEAPVAYSVKWRRIVLDEAHDVRDYNRVTAKAMRNLMARSRWCLTGTPIQNSIADVAGLYHFLNLEPYSDPRMFKEHIRLICNNPNSDAMANVQRLIRCIMLRRSVAAISLPDREDLICRLEFSPEELEVYDKARSSTLSMLDEAISGDQRKPTHLNVLPWINSLRMICNLGVRAKIPQLRPQNHEWSPIAAQEMFNSLEIAGSAVCSLCSSDLSSAATEAADQVSGMTYQPRIASCSHLICAPCSEKHGEDACSCFHLPSHQMLPVSTFSSEVSMNSDHVSQSAAIPTKVQALLQDLENHIDEEKCVVFSFWTSTLDAIEECLKKKSIGYIRFDGKVSHKQRAEVLRSFKDNDNVRVALMTISCGAVGLDLTSASRAYLMEPHWNPSVEQQALARIYRMGQTRKVTTIRYIMRDSFEDHVVNVQDRKRTLMDLLLSTEGRAESSNHMERLRQFRALIMS